MSNYRIIIRGVLPGHSADGVALSLARFSKKPPEKLKALLLSGKDLLAKRPPDMQPALRYKQMLEGMGCACHINAEITGKPDAEDGDNVVTSLTSLTTSRTGSTTAAQSFRYQRTPIAVQMRELSRLVKPLIATAIMGSAVYYGWAHGIFR